MQKEKILLLAGQWSDELIAIRRHLHAHPELSFQEYETAKYIEARLDEWKIPHQRVAGTGITGLLSAQSEGSYLVLRADMDALPIDELNEVSYRSVYPGVMHACGHDLHIAALLGAIRILSQSGNPLNGTIRFLFQPGEELLPGGALRVIESGLFDSRMPDLILAQHVYPELPAGWAGIRSGAYMASSDELYLTVKGRGGHAAMPHTLIDPVLIASQLIVNLQQIVSRKAPPDIPTVLSFGKFDAPGATNVIPSAVHLEGTFRTMDETWRKKALGLICRSADGLVTSMGGELECRVVPGYPALHNHPGKTAAVRALLKEYLGSDRVAELPLRMGSEDFARYGRMMPAVYYRLGTGIKNSSRAIHTAGFDVDESAVSLGAGLLAYLAVSLL